MSGSEACKVARLRLRELRVPGKLRHTPEDVPPSPAVSISDHDDDPPNYFFPKDKVLNYFRRKQVEEVLDCSCPACRKDRDSIKQSYDETLSTADLLKRIVPVGYALEKESVLALFLLMVYLRRPQLVRVLVMLNYSDVHLESWCKGLMHIHLQEPFRDLEITQEFVADFRNHMYRFTAPEIINSDFLQYNEHTILPFHQEKEVGNGFYGRVFYFEIYPTYNKFVSEVLHGKVKCLLCETGTRCQNVCSQTIERKTIKRKTSTLWMERTQYSLNYRSPEPPPYRPYAEELPSR